RTDTCVVAQRQRARATGQRGGPDRLEGTRDIEDAAAIDRVGAGSPHIERRTQENVGDLPARQVRKGLRQQRRGPGDLWSRIAGAGEEIDETLVVDIKLSVL